MTSSLSASDRSAGPILAAHPQVRDMPIKVFFLKWNMASALRRPRSTLPSQNAISPVPSFLFIVYSDERASKSN
jgi:hypothetical protein